MQSQPLKASDSPGPPKSVGGWQEGLLHTRPRHFYFDFLAEWTCPLSLSLTVSEDQFHKTQWGGQNRVSRPGVAERIVINYKNSNYKTPAVLVALCCTDKARGSDGAYSKQQYFCYTVLVKYFLLLIFINIVKTARGIYFKNLTLTF